MNKTAAALALVVCIAVAAAAVVYVVKIRQPAQKEAEGGDEFDSVDNLLSDLDDFLNFENQEFDYDLGEITGDWG